jgi:hypothetical protein
VSLFNGTPHTHSMTNIGFSFRPLCAAVSMTPVRSGKSPPAHEESGELGDFEVLGTSVPSSSDIAVGATAGTDVEFQPETIPEPRPLLPRAPPLCRCVLQCAAIENECSSPPYPGPPPANSAPRIPAIHFHSCFIAIRGMLSWIARAGCPALLGSGSLSSTAVYRPVPVAATPVIYYFLCM